jgi:hypothetical protein
MHVKSVTVPVNHLPGSVFMVSPSYYLYGLCQCFLPGIAEYKRNFNVPPFLLLTEGRHDTGRPDLLLLNSVRLDAHAKSCR